MLSIEYFAPAAPLRPWVSSYYLFRTDAPLLSDLLRAELPQVRFLLRGIGYLGFAGGPPQPMAAAVLTGPTNSAVRFDAHGPLTVFGMGLLPAGWAALVGVGADEVADRMIDLSDIAGPAALAAWHRMGEAGSGREIAAAADAFFLLLSTRARMPPLWFTRAADEWLAGSVDPTVDALVTATGMSARQIERLALRVYGSSPKLLARKYRALQAAVRLGLDPTAGWEAAAAGAFYDQPHFIREFKSFVGMTPSKFTAAGSPWLSRLTIAKRQDAAMPRLNRLS